MFRRCNLKNRMVYIQKIHNYYNDFDESEALYLKYKEIEKFMKQLTYQEIFKIPK